MKQAILVRTDLKMGKGKIASQVSHASVDSVLKSTKEVVMKWKKEGMKKIVLKVKDEAELKKYKEKAGRKGLKVVLIRDAGKTQIKPGSYTALAIGPDDDSKVDEVTSDLKIL